MDEKQNFYMLEVNTRVQVEHPVTETDHRHRHREDVDPDRAGEPSPSSRRTSTSAGTPWNAASTPRTPRRDFRPSPGKITTWQVPGGPGVRMDTHVVPGYSVPPNYDSMIGKLIVHAETRPECIDRMSRALRRVPRRPDQDDDPAAPAPHAEATSARAAWTSTTSSGC
jgi:acetyl-CoA carboxylase biotin carboxylase subunit